MRQFHCAHASGRPAAQLVEKCLAQIGELPSEANLGFLYATDALAGELDTVLARLKQGTGIEHWTGTVGVGLSATGREYYDQPALAVMIGCFPAGAFRTLGAQHGGVDGFAAAAAAWLKDDAFHFGIVHADPTNPRTPALVAKLAESIPGAFLVGGLTSSGGRHLQIADTVCSGGVSGVVFSSAVPVVTAHTQGCIPFARKHLITACAGNVIVELDGRPALDVFNEDVGEVFAKDLSRVAGYIFVGLPIPGSDTGDYLVRNLIGIDLEQKLIAVGDMLSVGSEIVLCRRDGNSAREDLLRMLADLKRRLPDTPKGAVYYSCLGRGRAQFGPDSEELRIIGGELGELPLVGFFASGEIFHNRLYGYTGVLTVFC